MGKGSKSKFAAARRSDGDRKSVKPPGDLWIDLLWLLPALVLGALVYANTLNGEFVYDDLRQIVRNTLIQDGSKFWQAMTSDVWAFKGGDEASSNYWRPSFVFWMILNFRFFGLNVAGWHLTNILLHLAVVALAFLLLRRLHVSRAVAGAIALLFAVHPVHTESIAWISGAPDLILGAALLGATWFVISLSEKQTAARWAWAIILYMIALGAKEVAILYPLVVVAVLSAQGNEKTTSRPQIWSITWPFAAVGVLYLIARFSILGIVERSPEGAANLGQAILTTPAVFAFYLRQMILPYWIGPSYPIRALTTSSIGLENFFIPLVVTGVVAWWMIWIAGRSRLGRIGLALLLVPLLPAMNITAFHPEQLVHDRYLYLPLLGFLILVLPALGSLLQQVAKEQTTRVPLLLFILALLLAVPLAAQTIRYNRAWMSNVALWEWGVGSDPNSSFNYQQYGVHLQKANRLEEAATALNRSIEIHPMPTSYVSRATVLIDQNHFAEAERDLHEVTSKEIAQVSPYAMYQAYERLAVCKQQQRKLGEASAAIAEGRRRLPQYNAALTEKLAVILYQSDDKKMARDELNAVRAQGRIETLPESRLIFYRLGLLNDELGNPEEARAAYREFLSLTEHMLTPDIDQARTQSKAALAKLNNR
jgi:tetratricopeptide (TPR) repeat protein